MLARVVQFADVLRDSKEQLRKVRMDHLAAQRSNERLRAISMREF